MPLLSQPRSKNILLNKTKASQRLICGVEDAFIRAWYQASSSEYTVILTEKEELPMSCLQFALYTTTSDYIGSPLMLCVPAPLCGTTQPRCSPRGENQSFDYFPPISSPVYFHSPIQHQLQTTKIRITAWGHRINCNFETPVLSRRRELGLALLPWVQKVGPAALGPQTDRSLRMAKGTTGSS